MDRTEFKITADGSHTLYLEALDETYHSKHGAIQEARHVFIQAGIRHLDKKVIKVLEVGFGTGLNAYLSLLEAAKKKCKVKYSSIEAYPLAKDVIARLNYTAQLNSKLEEIELFNRLHDAEWESYQQITEHFFINKLNVKIEEFISLEKFDLIYFDAFGPRVQPEMWTETIFKKMYNSLVVGGVLVTYCAKGSVKRMMKSIGFEVEVLPGPPGKREMTRAVKKL